MVLIVGPVLAGCQGDHLSRPSVVDPAVLYWTLDLSHHAVTLSTTAPYDTLTLTAVPRNQAGEALTGLPAPVYRSTNPDQVVVTAAGVLVAAQPTPGAPVAVIATLTTDNLKHEDTVLVRVVDAPTPPMLGTFALATVAPDSAKIAMTLGAGSGTSGLGPAYLLNRLVQASYIGGVPMDTVSADFAPFSPLDFPAPVPVAGLLVAFRVSDTTIAALDINDNVQIPSINGVQFPVLRGRRPGVVAIYASATVFGVTKTDTLSFRVGYPMLGIVFFNVDGGDLAIHPVTARVGAGGVVFFTSPNVPSDLTFADPTNVAAAADASSYFPFACFFVTSCDQGGNNPLYGGPSTPFFGVGRVFHVPGVYTYQHTFQRTPGGATETLSGTVEVVDER